mmetsp:Transcript_53263/g.127402  ORF Transcript_53263/g.127402 Transcript_53263/m.127402 type:complete len:143 (-) Transcript_53263:142-570(-)
MFALLSQSEKPSSLRKPIEQKESKEGIVTETSTFSGKTRSLSSQLDAAEKSSSRSPGQREAKISNSHTASPALDRFLEAVQQAPERFEATVWRRRQLSDRKLEMEDMEVSEELALDPMRRSTRCALLKTATYAKSAKKVVTL